MWSARLERVSKGCRSCVSVKKTHFPGNMKASSLLGRLFDPRFWPSKGAPSIETVNKGPTQKGCEGLCPTQDRPLQSSDSKNLMVQAHSSPKVPIMGIWVFNNLGMSLTGPINHPLYKQGPFFDFLGILSFGRSFEAGLFSFLFFFFFVYPANK